MMMLMSVHNILKAHKITKRLFLTFIVGFFLISRKTCPFHSQDFLEDPYCYVFPETYGPE